MGSQGISRRDTRGSHISQGLSYRVEGLGCRALSGSQGLSGFRVWVLGRKVEPQTLNPKP